VSIPAIIAKHRHITEREAGSWDDCAWCSAVMFARLVHDPSIPATHAEAKLLRAASGEPTTGGSNTDNLLVGFRRRYGFVPATVVGYSNLWAYLSKPGRVAVAMGKMGAFPAGYTLRRFDPGFTGGHSVFVARCDSLLRVWWDDPLAPQGGTLNYQGQYVSQRDLARFVKAFGNIKLVVGTVKVVTPPPAPAEGDTNVAQKAITSDVPAAVDVNAGTPLFDLDGTTKRTTLSISVKGRLSPFAVGAQRAIYATTAGIKKLYLVTPVAGSVKPIVDTTPYNQSQLDAKRAEGVTVGVESEKKDIRTRLGL
jgi:hypothetical protein